MVLVKAFIGSQVDYSYTRELSSKFMEIPSSTVFHEILWLRSLFTTTVLIGGSLTKTAANNVLQKL